LFTYDENERERERCLELIKVKGRSLIISNLVEKLTSMNENMIERNDKYLADFETNE
jgi:metal-responsive CopG/Arc/MetJ family transcriptional regulator